jgi:hypothetical protein
LIYEFIFDMLLAALTADISSFAMDTGNPAGAAS